MTKKLRSESIYVAPGITGKLDEHANPVVFDEVSLDFLNPENFEDKIKIYERQVKEWFLKPASRHLKGKNNGFVILMICFSYLEGIEQYYQGRSSEGRSCVFFIKSIKRIYSSRYTRRQLEELYSEARCGLFHNGMTKGKIIISYDFSESIIFFDSITIRINPKILLEDIKQDFDNYLNKLRNEDESLLRASFNDMFSLL